MALPVVIPNTFANATASIPLSQLDSNFNTLSNVINQINAGTQQLANANVAVLIVTGNATIGDASSDTVTLNSTLTANTAVIFTAGTSAAPAITTTGDTNTGIFFPAADTIAFTEGGAEAMRIDSDGDVGIGTSSPGARLDVRGGVLQVQQGSADSANFSIITSSTPSSGTTLRASWTGSGSQGPMIFDLGGTERARITSGGDFLVGTTNISATAGQGFKVLNLGLGNEQLAVVSNTALADVTHITLYNTNATNNGYRFYVLTNGGVANFSGNNVNLSDERMKTNIEVSGQYLDKICAIPVKLFNYKDENEGEQRTLGVVAQDVEAVAPELVNSTDGWQGTEPEDGVPLKTIYTTDMMFAMMKSIQELKAITDTQAQTISALEARIAALEND